MKDIWISLLSGALGGSFISVIYNYFAEKRKLKVDLLKLQIDKLYGPLYFLINYSSQCFDIANSILNAHKNHFSQVWAKDKETQDSLKEDSDKTINVSNKYVDMANSNNEKLFKIIKENYSYIDLDDLDIFEKFVKNYSRLKIERSGQTLPPMIYRIVGDISFLPADFKDRVFKKFEEKKIELTKKTYWLKNLFGMCRCK